MLGSTVDWEPPAGAPKPAAPMPARDVPTQPQPATVRHATNPALHRLNTSPGVGKEHTLRGTGDSDDDPMTPRSGMGNIDLTFDVNRSSDPGLMLDLPGDDAGDALDLAIGRVSSSIAPAEPSRAADPLGELRERYALGDFSGALTIAEGILEDKPDNADVQRYAESCRDVLLQMYAARLGAMNQVPTVAVPPEQLRWLTLDHRAGFLLSHVDGVSSLEEILDISGMPHLEAMRIIYDLMQQRVIVLQ